MSVTGWCMDTVHVHMCACMCSCSLHLYRQQPDPYLLQVTGWHQKAHELAVKLVPCRLDPKAPRGMSFVLKGEKVGHTSSPLFP